MGLLDQQYRDDELVDEESAKLAGEYTFEKYRIFVEQYSDRLRIAEDAIDESLSELWNANADPIALHIAPYEQASFVELVRTGHKPFNKVVVVLSSLIDEVRQLENEAHRNIFPAFVMHGETLSGDDDKDDGEVQLMMGRFLPKMQETVVFVQRLATVTQNFVQQLGALYSPKMAQIYNVSGVHFTHVFEALGDLITLAVSLEEVIRANISVRDSWALYRRMVKAMLHDPARFNTTLEDLRALETTLEGIEDVLLTDLIIHALTGQGFDFGELVEVSRNRALKEEFEFQLRTILDGLLVRMGQHSETDERQRLVGLCGLVVLNFQIWKEKGDKKFFRDLWGTHAIVPIVHLYGPAFVFPTTLLLKEVPELCKLYAGKVNMDQHRAQFLESLAGSLPGIAQALHLQVSAWMVRVESNLAKSASIGQVLNNRLALFTQGIVLSYNIGHAFKTALGLHTMLRRPIVPQVSRPMCQLLELLKAIAFTYHRRSSLVAENVAHMVQQICLAMHSTFGPLREQLEAQRANNVNLDAIAALDLFIEAVDGCATPSRRILIPFGFAVIQQRGLSKGKQLEEFKQQLHRLSLITRLQEHIAKSTDCSVFYCSRAMLRPYFKSILSQPSDAHRLPYILAAVRDAYPMLIAATQIENNGAYKAYKDFVEATLQETIVQPLCHKVEEILRKYVHCNLLLSDRINPFKQDHQDLTYFFKIRRLVLFDTVIDIKTRVSHYLDTAFYNHTSVALKNWRTYEEMRTSAYEMFGLQLVDVHLPGQDQYQGLDVLEIMRKIDVFVSNFNYNLNNQIFVERASQSRTLNTIGIPQIAHSIRTHGMGIMNTAVNYVYGFLREKFVVLSTFLYDDHIQSPLLKEIKWYKQEHENVANQYPFDRAETFNREIRKLGMNNNLSYLDQFRILVTEIGNAMGYIRMIRSGGLHHCADAIKFVPDLTNIVSFKEFSEEDGLAPETIEAAQLLDTHISALSRNFAEGTEYFQMLVDVMAKQLRDKPPLANFYIIVPPMTINYIEHILSSKERLMKKNKEGAAFTDDGFALGVAFLLKVLDQTAAFQSLHWFQSVQTRHKNEEERVNAEREGQKKDKRAAETAQLLLARLTSFLNEFELLYYTLSGAMIFFKE